MWKILSSKEIFNHQYLTLIEDNILLSCGTKINYLKFKDKGNSVTLISKRNNGEILLSREYSHPPQEILFQFPGGFVPFNENLEKGANRELMEETGFKANSLQLLGNYLINNRRSNSKMYVYLATQLIKRSLKGDLEEDIKSYWFTEKEIDNMIKNGEIINVNVLASWSLYKLKTNFEEVSNN
jgi:ADP-ribose pyrophosphatase